jgi:hypothetical protein
MANIAMLAAVATQNCLVSFTGPTGVTHTVSVQAESVFEAAARALAQLQRSVWLKDELSLTTQLVVRIDSPAREAREFKVEIKRLLAWFDGKGPDRAKRFQLKRLLERPQDSPRINKRIRAH